GLGLTLMNLGRYDDALVQLRRALAVRVLVFGEEHVEVATARHNLGDLYQALGACEESLAESSRALAIWSRMLSPDHPALVVGHEVVGRALACLGRDAHALAEYERALAVVEARHERARPRSVGPIVGSACALAALRRQPEAERRFREG